jgi:hypothetical protein
MNALAVQILSDIPLLPRLPGVFNTVMVITPRNSLNIFIPLALRQLTKEKLTNTNAPSAQSDRMDETQQQHKNSIAAHAFHNTIITYSLHAGNSLLMMTAIVGIVLTRRIFSIVVLLHGELHLAKMELFRTKSI